MSSRVTYILLVLTMVFWAINFFLVKVAMEYYTPLGVATWRYIFAVVVLAGIAIFKFKDKLFQLRLSMIDLWYIFLNAFLGVFLTIYFFNLGMKTASAINGSLIIATSPAITALFSLMLLGRKLTAVQLLAIVISFFGVAIILVKGNLMKLAHLHFDIGDIYILMMAIVFSLSQIIVSKFLQHVDSVLMTTISSVIGLVLFATFASPEILSVNVPGVTRFWMSILFMGVLGTGVAYTAFYYCVVNLGATITSLYLNLIPFFVILLAIPFGEKIELSQLIGGLIVVSGLLLYNKSKSVTQ